MAAVGKDSTECRLPYRENPGKKDALYAQLWHACAGPNVSVPRIGEKVFYFPQGHIEQVEAYTSQDGMTDMPIYNLPSKILCRVVNLQLKAEAQTDEVFAQITLIPLDEDEEDPKGESSTTLTQKTGACSFAKMLTTSNTSTDGGFSMKQDEEDPEGESATTLTQKTSACSFAKILTPSDTSTHGGFSVPKRYADECFPPLDISQQPPSQELVAKDLHGYEWHFRHIFRGQPKRHLLTSGWSTFVTAKKLVAGDACIFLRGENMELRIGVRRMVKVQNNAPSVISGHILRHGILASAFHGISTGAMFTVYYRPWSSSSEFVIPYDIYMKSAENSYDVGTRFKICFQGEECSKKRFAGTIVAIEDQDCIRWPSSEWKCLKVQWDAASEAFLDPKKLSPWEVEPMESINTKDTAVLPPLKRACLLDPSSSGFSDMAEEEVLQGQERIARSSHNQGSQISSSVSQSFLPSNPYWNGTQLRLQNQLHFPGQGLLTPFYQYSGNAMTIAVKNTVSQTLLNQYPPMFAAYEASARNFSVTTVNHNNSGYNSRPRNVDEAPISQPNGCGRCMLFGVDLINNHLELPSPKVSNYADPLSPCLPTSPSSVTEPTQPVETSRAVSGAPYDKQCNKCFAFINRSCTKVLKHGSALGRSVDLIRFERYDELIAELDQMFDFKGSLMDASSGWKVTYIDNEGDRMLVGDHEWQLGISAIGLKNCISFRRKKSTD